MNLLQTCLHLGPRGRRTERRRKRWRFIPCFWNHSSYGQRRSPLLQSFRCPATQCPLPMCHWRFPWGRQWGENAVKMKRVVHTDTHTLRPRVPLSYCSCQKMKSNLEALFICSWCAGLAFRWPWSPASLYLMKISGNSQPVYWCFEIWPPYPVCLLLFLVHR